MGLNQFVIHPVKDWQVSQLKRSQQIKAFKKELQSSYLKDLKIKTVPFWFEPFLVSLLLGLYYCGRFNSYRRPKLSSFSLHNNLKVMQITSTDSVANLTSVIVEHVLWSDRQILTHSSTLTNDIKSGRKIDKKICRRDVKCALNI